MTDDLELGTIREHYARITPVMEELADVDGNLTIGLNDYSGWYVRRDQDDFELIEEGYDQEARCATLATDYATVQGRIERALYTVTTYKSRDAFVDWEPCTFEDGETKWRTSSPTPGYGDLRGVMAWGDIDLADDLKPQRGDLDEDTQQVIDETLEAYIDEYARLYGDRDAVFGLDSVGGSYIMGAPAATLPIAELFDEDADARERVMEAFVDRSNEWLKEAQDRVEDRVDGAAEVIDPDWVNNCNRQYKAPLSLHTDHDAVVVPLNTDAPSYELVPFSDVDDDLVEATASWAADLTDTEYRDHAETLVKRLWPDEYETHDGWEAALKSWAEAESEREERQEQARLRARQRRRERKEQMGSGFEGAPITPFREDVYDAIDRIDTADVVRKHASDAWNTGRDSNDKIEFDPSWRTSESGSSCFVDTANNSFGDSGMGGGGSAVEAIALGDPSINYSDPSDTLDGEEWRQAVNALRQAGHEIPVHTPDANSVDGDGDEYEQMPYWSVRKAAVALGVVPEEAFIRAQSDRGGYLRFPGKETYNHALAAIEDAGLEHGREYMSSDGSRPEDLEQAAQDSDRDAPPAPSPDPQDDRSAEVRSPDQGDGDDDGGSGINNFGAYSELDTDSGGYGYWHTNHDTGETHFERVTNFTIDVDSFLFNGGDRLIDMTVVPGTGEESYDLTVATKVFNDARRFRDNIVTGLTTTFEGGPSDLNELRKLVGGQDAPVRTGTHHMGLHPDAGEFVTPQGVLTADGWVEEPEMFYIEREISAERAWGLTPDENDEYDPEEVAEILELIPQSRFSERFLPAMGWLYAAPLRPHVQEWEGQFNTLHVTGETGAGKSSTLSVLWQLLGMDGEPMACDDTKFALMTSMASTNSIPMWYDEYKPGDMKDWEVDRFQNLMRSTTRGGIATRGNADKSTEEYELKAPLMISGEQSIQGPAEERRSIQTRFRDGVKEPGSPTKKAFAHLTGMAYDAGGETREPEGYDLEQHALAYYQFVLRQDAETLKNIWRESREHVRDLLTVNDVTGVDDLPRQGIQTVHFGMSLYRRFTEEMAVEASLSTEELDLPTTEEINDALLYIAEQFGDGGSRKSHMDRFLELTSRAATEDYLEEDKHFALVNEGEPDEQLALKLSSVHDRVSKYVRDHGLDGEDLLNSAKDYRDRMREASDDNTSYIVTHSQNTPPLARCARIDTQIAEEKVEFSRLAFGAEPRDDGDSVEGDNDGGDGGPPNAFGAQAIEDVAEDPTGYATVTVDVLTVEVPDHEDAPALKATVKDRSTAIDVISWNDPNALPDEGAFVLENVAVGKHGGDVQLTIREGVTEIRPIQHGVGYTEPAEGDTKDQEQLRDTDVEKAAGSDGGTSDGESDEVADAEQSSADDAATADGGETSARDAVPQYTQSVAETVRDAGEPVGVAYIIQNTEGSPEPLREAIESAREQGKITKEGDDKYVV